MVKVKLGAITKKVPESALKWYKEEKKLETNSEEITST